MTAEVLFFQMREIEAAGTDLDAHIKEHEYPPTALTEEEASAPGGYYGYLIPDAPGGAFVRIAFAHPCSQEARLDAARAFLHLRLLQRSYA